MTDRAQCAGVRQMSVLRSLLLTVTSLSPCNSNHAPLWPDLTMSAACHGTAMDSVVAQNHNPRLSHKWQNKGGRKVHEKARMYEWPHLHARATKERAICMRHQIILSPNTVSTFQQQVYQRHRLTNVGEGTGEWYLMASQTVGAFRQAHVLKDFRWDC